MALKCKVMSRIIGKNVGDWGKKMVRTLRVASAQEQRVSGAVRASGSWLATSPKEAIRGWRMGTEVRRGMEFRKRSAHLIVLWTGGLCQEWQRPHSEGTAREAERAANPRRSPRFKPVGAPRCLLPRAP